MYQTVRFPNPNGITIPDQCEHLQPVPCNIKDSWSVAGNITLRKLKESECSVFFKDSV